MCRLIVLIILLCFGLTAFGQSRIKGRVKNFYGSYISIYLPEKGVDFPSKPFRLPIDDEGRFDVALPTSGSGFARFYHYGASTDVRLWISPQSVDEMEVDMAKSLASIRFSGTNQWANELLNSGKILRTEYPKDEAWVKDLLKTANTLPRLLAEAAKRKQKEQAIWDEQRKAGKITEALHTVLSRESVYFWHFLALEVFSEKEGKGFEAISSLKREEINDPEALKTRYYFHYLRKYFEALHPQLDHEERCQKLAELLRQPVLEPFWAHYLHYQAQYGDRDYSLVPALRGFRRQYPGSPWIALLSQPIDKLEDAHMMSLEPITDDLVISEDPTEFASIQDLIARYKGEVLYFDLWASWCGPCIEEFKLRYRNPLKAFIKDKPVRVIYLSIDRDSAHKKWIEAVKANRLNSMNVRFEGERLKGLMEFLGHDWNKPIAIPWYFIVDKEGKLVNSQAPPPSQKERLLAALRKHL